MRMASRISRMCCKRPWKSVASRNAASLWKRCVKSSSADQHADALAPGQSAQRPPRKSFRWLSHCPKCKRCVRRRRRPDLLALAERLKADEAALGLAERIFIPTWK